VERDPGRAPMVTPCHGLGPVVLGDWIHVAGGGPVVGGGTQSSIHKPLRSVEEAALPGCARSGAGNRD
jgi:hypothetical protein